MADQTRREFFGRGGLAALGIGALTLRADVLPTETSGDEDVPEPFELPTQDKELKPTDADIEGPYFRGGSPYRGKVTPPLAEGDVLVMRGRVWSYETKKPLAGALVHVWQANKHGRYDNDDPRNPPKKGVYLYRARVRTDERGFYEYETIHPGRYQVGDTFRPAHIHYRIEAAGHKTLITQLYFKGDPFNARDRFFKKSLMIDPKRIQVGDAGSYGLGTFDIVLRKR